MKTLLCTMVLILFLGMATPLVAGAPLAPRGVVVYLLDDDPQQQRRRKRRRNHYARTLY